jgi:hypothetical protein
VPRTFNHRLSLDVRRADLIIHPTVSETASNVQLVYPATLSEIFAGQTGFAGSVEYGRGLAAAHTIDILPTAM